MKKYISLGIIILLLLSGCSISEPVEYLWNEEEVRNIKFDRNLVPSDHKLKVIKYILSNTTEVNIHRMRGENENKVFIKEDPDSTGCFEAVYNEEGELVTNTYNQASYNFYCYDEYPIKHFNADILPWLLWGNTEDDPTSFNERMYYYTLDLNYGIQSYIFSDDFDKYDKVNFDTLTESEKMTYRFFNYLLFNDEYLIKLEEKNIDKLKKDGEFYSEYFYQIQDQLDIK